MLFNGVSATFTVNTDTLFRRGPHRRFGASDHRRHHEGHDYQRRQFAVAHARSLTMTFGRSSYATGVLRVTDAFRACRQGMKSDPVALAWRMALRREWSHLS